MKVLLSWLREFAPIEGEPQFIADQLSALGLAVEEMQLIGGNLAGIVTARVLALRPHPKADRIQLVDVDAGDGEPLQVCCGAFNMAVGDVVPFATLGTTMPNGMLIERRKLRGEWSNGMLCAAREVGLADAVDGIMILPPELPLGVDFATAMGIETDVLYDLDVTGNRPDALSVAGVARDLAAWLKVPFTMIDPPLEVDPAWQASGLAAVDIVDGDLCGRFHARVLDGIAVGPSPRWLADRLTALGMRPINNVVDVSNYVMLELGQPSHTFDLNQVSGRRIRVRWARDGETVETLDGQTRTLTAADGAICDGDDGVIGIAGVMGGASTEISETTTDVLLEMAWWDPLSIARTARRLGLRSEASTRFERGSDPGVIDVAMRRFVQLLRETTPVRVAAGEIVADGNLPTPATVTLRTARTNAMLGVSLSRHEIAGLLEPIGFRCEVAGEDLTVTVPSFRMVDTTTEIDVIEEVGRHHGFARIERTVPRPTGQAGALSTLQQERRALRHSLVGFGLTEVMPLPFLAPGDLARAGLDADGIRVTNPLVEAESVMRTSLLPGILKTLAFNASHRNPDVECFELGHVFLPTDRSAELPDEREHLGVALGGSEAPAALDAWQVVVDTLGIASWRLVTDTPAGMHPTRSARIEVANTTVGALGEVDPQVLADYGVDRRVAWLQVDLTTLLALPHGPQPYRRVSRYPSSDVDLAFVVPEPTPAADVARALRKGAGALLAELTLFDVYRGDRVAAGSRSLAYRLRFQAPDRTLTDAEVAEVRQRCIDAVTSTVPAQLRG
ncbi:MAG: phenylalanine--tRNA ligase subunit beta [Acidimicrobiales bacterium]|nr:phenylalanine--tRNA ligase subunit beta [Acidimicrobiales bacterium]